MKYILFVLLLFVGCDSDTPRELKYHAGDVVQFRDSKRPGIITYIYLSNIIDADYKISYEDGVGVRHDDNFKEFQIEDKK